MIIVCNHISSTYTTFHLHHYNLKSALIHREKHITNIMKYNINISQKQFPYITVDSYHFTYKLTLTTCAGMARYYRIQVCWFVYISSDQLGSSQEARLFQYVALRVHFIQTIFKHDNFVLFHILINQENILIMNKIPI